MAYQEIEVSISDLKVSHEDEWLKDWHERRSDVITADPRYLYLVGQPQALADWANFRDLSLCYFLTPLMEVLIDVARFGQKEPIKVYSNYLINDGHKRASVMTFLGYDKIKAIVVSNNTKL